ncbi:hypothetical protein AGDE_07783 [Angomonas deanei]|nr:hypothetical protein AGDE_08819 [Angomonas deanei]EPY34853.1 hypothetical protein AGDE_07783 [Angomonas deanei]|eukprot:EPY32184.1 hypothetical protein AGDE_08819 [Angomonas deanei]
MLDPLLADVNPSINLRAAQVRTLRGVFPAAVSVSESPDGTTVEKLPPVTLNSVLDLLSSLLAPSAEDTEGVTENNCSAALQSVYEEAAVIFTMENYPQEQVPALDVLSFLAAFLSLLPNQTGGPDAVKMILQRLQSSAPLVQASTAAKGANQPGATAGLSCMTHTGVRTERKFDTYRTNDRRDEWLRGRDEQDARPQYQKHVVGYGGHLPEYRYHFGRTFHVIEEDLPALTKPKEQKEAIPPDAFGKPIELKYSRQSEHHHKFA